MNRWLKLVLLNIVWVAIVAGFGILALVAWR